MTAWTEGYVADIPYALGFYRETVPAHIAFAATCVGKHPGLSFRPKRVLELGFGMGLGFVINAAANPNTHFEGVDFNPLHVAHARGLIDEAELTNVSVREASFQDLAREADEGQHDLDLIVLHGILTWVSAEAHEAIVEITRKRLKPGGMLYVSYNCMPGWAPVLPLQRLMRENARRVSGRSDQQTASGIELVKALTSEGAAYFKTNTGLQQRIEKMEVLDKNYLAHEYLNANWFIFHFADVADMFSRAKLDFVGSATIGENVDGVSVPEGVRARIGAEADPIFKETLRDVASNKQFRRDLFARGSSTLTPAEHSVILGATHFVLAVPRSQVSFKITSLLGDLDANPEIYGAVADLLGEKTASFAEIASLPVFREGGTRSALQVIGLFVHSGQVLPAPGGDAAIHTLDPRSAQRLNRVIAEKMLQGRTYSFLAAPIAGSGVQAAATDLLMLAAVLNGQGESTETTSTYVIQAMQRLGINWVKEGKTITDPTERQIVVRADSETFLSEKLPFWRRLGVL
ncbi:class I SAM-dependent methyltransferase [Methylobacterium planeticum]|uniref:Methyltransferase domain-containing protein n=1 Tax=Methylobacterium planeticum TaxID=2615211 RepID=A0A6N6MDG1_9HYPH|nr:class I SAM-dependent methyltransferase [Methylobacterium planeticum]KAB1068739.1 methyltransferase domain-containing protein [Methylobacterium planeticum]